MKKKNNLFKNIFFMLSALCLLSTGFYALLKTDTDSAVAEDTSYTLIDNSSVPEYFSRNEYVGNNSTITENSPYTNGLISSDTYMYFEEAGKSNSIRLSLNRGNSDAQTNDLYRWVYYPDTDNLSHFYCYTVETVGLSINGVKQNIQTGNFKQTAPSSLFFTNFSGLELNGFEMTFSKYATDGSNICILDEKGKVKEGLYTVDVTYILHECFDGKSDGSEESIADVTLENPTISYNFYCFDKSTYFKNDRPNINYYQFDRDVLVSNLSNPNYSYYLYSNYSSDNDNENKTYQIPYIDYDFTRFDISISKNINDENYLEELSFDKDTSGVVASGKDTVKTKILNENTCRIFFTDVGNYSLTLNAIATLDYQNNDSTSEFRKYDVNAISGVTKKIMVYVYGYQANYTDHDAQADENNVKPIAELKRFNLSTQKYENGADITSQLLNSSATFSQDNYDTTFVTTTVVNYIQNNDIVPIKTNQTPIKFTFNGTTSTKAPSYILAKKQISSAYTQYNIGGQTWWRKDFTGGSESVEGEYVYLLGYTFKDYYNTETSKMSDKVFYQVFYFEINKELPSVSASTDETAETILTGSFTNNNVILDISNTQQPEYYNKSVTTRIYAYDYDTRSYLTQLGGENGISFDDLLKLDGYKYYVSGVQDEMKAKLSLGARYTVRLYYTNELTSNNTSINSNSGYFRQQYFTIDKTSLSGISGRNVTELSNSTDYKIGSTLENFSTNQSIILSWNEKNSGARTFAYYRYFPIVADQFYSKNDNDTSRESMISQTLNKFLNMEASAQYLPINNFLNLSASSSNIWLPYKGNTLDSTNRISTEYVLRDEGMYMVDIYDEAGNHTVDLFMIDKTAPIFAIKGDNDKYQLVSSSIFITTDTTVYWGNYKSMFITNFPNSVSFTSKTPDEVNASDLRDEIYKNYNGNIDINIYKTLYNKLFDKNYMQNLSPNITTTANDKVYSYLNNSYNGYYLTIPINPISYISADSLYAKTENVYSYKISANREAQYGFLIRDMSNTVYDQVDTDKGASIQYTAYYSAKQTIKISFDDSKFLIYYLDNAGNIKYIDDDYSNKLYTVQNYMADETKKEKTTYLSPFDLKKQLNLSFLPTKQSKEGDQTIQVDQITINYYPFVTKDYKVGDITYHYKAIDFDNNTTIQVYKYGNPDTASETEIVRSIKLNSDNITAEGRYEIVRTYMTTSPFSYNPIDYFSRKYVLYVDRNEVITNAELVNDEGQSHLESLVGGDIFVSVFDNGKNADLVVTFPDSTSGNTKGSTLYNNGTTDSLRTVLSTNKLPVKIYVPQYKYTTYAERLSTPTGGYEYRTNFDIYDTDSLFDYDLDENGNRKAQNKDSNQYFVEKSLIPEYLMYAEIFYTNSSGYQTKLATTRRENIFKISKSTDGDGNESFEIVSSSTIQENGFLKFFAVRDNSVLNYLKDAGQYEVRIYQGYADGLAGSFRNYSSFAFEIQATDPDFEAKLPTGTSLNSEISRDLETYYTNQADLNLIWDAGSEFITDIDFDETIFKTKAGATYKYKKESGTSYVENINSASDKRYIFNIEPKLDGTSYLTQINLRKLGVYSNGDYVDITMQYKNHENAKDGSDYLYKKVTKRVYVDLEAPETNINELVNNTINSGLISSLTVNALREYRKANYTETTTDLNETSFNVSSTTIEPFAYYSYMVSTDYLTKLKSIISSSEASEVYFREFGNKYLSNVAQETSPEEFNKTKFSSIADFDGSSETAFEPFKYYEIVEIDLAGNMTIYTVYVTSDENDTVNTSNNQLLTYTMPDTNGTPLEKNYSKDDYKAVLAYNNATHNIYSPTSFNLKKINYFGDAWAQIRLTTRNANGVASTKYLMLSPWDSENAYLFSGTTYTKVAISDLINGSVGTQYKNVMQIYDRRTARFTSFYINIRNSRLSWYMTDNQEEEYIRFNLPQDADIQNTLYATNYVTRIRITADNTELCDVENKLGYGSLWTALFENNRSVLVTANNTGLKFALNPAIGFAPNTKILYEFTDNYGTKNSEIHLYNETIISQEIQSSEDLYAYYDTMTGRLIYITKNNLKYIYNASKYKVTAYYLDQNGTPFELSDTGDSTAISSPEIPKGITMLTISTERKDNKAYDNLYKIVVNDTDNRFVKEIYFKLYDYLPTKFVEGADPANPATLSEGQFKITDTNGTNITDRIADSSSEGYFSEVKISFRDYETQPFLPVKYSISTDKENWNEIESGKIIRCETEEMQKYYLKIWYDETLIPNEFGSNKFIFSKVPNEQIYEFNLSALTSTYWVEKTINGKTELVEKSNKIYKAKNGAQYSNHYQVNVSYANRGAIEIRTNKEQDIDFVDQYGNRSKTKTPFAVYTDSSLVTSEVYYLTNRKVGATSDIPYFETKFVISYIPDSDNFVEEFYTYNLNGSINTSENLTTLDSKSLIVPESYTNFKSIELQWTKYYGIAQNEISAEVLKDGIALTPTIYSRDMNGKKYNYITLNYSGKYSIRLKDVSGNIQKFNRNQPGQTEWFEFTFIKDVPFTVTYTDIKTGQEVTSLPIKEAVYNGTVTINIDKDSRSELYSLGGFPSITVTRNGEDYTDQFQNDTTFIFSESGYYEIYFTATSKSTEIGTIRKEKYQFTILNANEYRYSYIFNKYSNYYVEKVEKDGEDVTEKLTRLLNVSTITLNKTKYLTSLPLSSIDEKTGAGEYYVTVNANEKIFKDGMKFTYKVIIKTGSAPIKISLEEGKSTTKNITIEFNQTNIYRELGECKLQIVTAVGDRIGSTYYSKDINSETIGDASATISDTGTYYIQIVSPSGNLLYSYKVIRKEPLNAAAIIAIVISAVVFIALVIIIIKLRKRISVK